MKKSQNIPYKNCMILTSKEEDNYGQELGYLVEINGPGYLSNAGKFRHELDAILWAKAYIDGWLARDEVGPQSFVESGAGQTDGDTTVRARVEPGQMEML